jgi:hypothetical protein
MILGGGCHQLAKLNTAHSSTLVCDSKPFETGPERSASQQTLPLMMTSAKIDGSRNRKRKLLRWQEQKDIRRCLYKGLEPQREGRRYIFLFGFSRALNDNSDGNFLINNDILLHTQGHSCLVLRLIIGALQGSTNC